MHSFALSLRTSLVWSSYESRRLSGGPTVRWRACQARNGTHDQCRISEHVCVEGPAYVPAEKFPNHRRHESYCVGDENTDDGDMNYFYELMISKQIATVDRSKQQVTASKWLTH